MDQKRSSADALRPAPVDPVLGRYKSDEFVRIVRQWGGVPEGRRFFKTDLNEEAFAEDQVLFSLSSPSVRFFGIDVSPQAAQAAHRRQQASGLGHHYAAGDVRRLPFQDGAFELILSSSTLDHFDDGADLSVSLKELRRVLAPAGVLILALNNRHNPNFYWMSRLEGLLQRRRYPMQFFTFAMIRRAADAAGFLIDREGSIVHLPSPANTALRFLRRMGGGRLAELLGRRVVRAAEWFGARAATRLRTGWFLVVSCRKKP